MPEAETSLTEVIRRGSRTLNDEGVDAWIEGFTTPDFVWDVEPMGLGRYQGRAAFREFFNDWIGSYDEWFSEVIEIDVIGPEIAVADVRQGGTLPGAKEPIELRWAQLNLWRGDRVHTVINYSTVDEARAAAADI